MRRKLVMAVALALTAAALSACGAGSAESSAAGAVEESAGGAVQEEETKEETKEETDGAGADDWEAPEQTAGVLDKAWLEAFDRDFVESEDYNPLFADRCFYVEGVRVHIPTTVRGFERLFGTTFTVTGEEAFTFRDKRDYYLKVEFAYEDAERCRDGNSYDDRIKDVPILGFTHNPESQKDILSVNHVTYEPVLEARDEERFYENKFGYYSAAGVAGTHYYFYPDCYQAYALYMSGTLPAELIEAGTESGLDCSMVSFGDVTLDAMDEMFVFQDDAVYGFTYDTADRKLRRIYYAEPVEMGYYDINYLDTGGIGSEAEGTLNIEEYVDTPSEDSRHNSRRNCVFVLNRYGKMWQLAELERWQDENYDLHCRLNGEEVDEAAYSAARDLYVPVDCFRNVPNIDLLRAGRRNNDFGYKSIMSHKEELEPYLEAVGYDPDARP